MTLTENKIEAPNTDPISDVWKYGASPLDKIFKPQSVAVIGATETEGSVGRTVFNNLISKNFAGRVYPVNLKRKSVLGVPAFPDIASVPEKVDLAVVVTPAALVPQVIQECADVGITSAIVISAGFKELGAPGVELESKIFEIIRKNKMRLIGPNCLGVMNPTLGFNATFARDIAKPGKIAFLSQSGALCTAVLDWSFREQVGFSAFVSIGSMLDISWGDLIDYFGNDPQTESIIIYMESIGNARAFLSAAREVSLNKPIIIIKAGRTEAAAMAAASHTGSLTGSDDALDEAFNRVGVLRVNEISELFDMSEVLAKQPLPKGPNLTILTNAGGPGVLATDALILAKGKLTELSDKTFKELNEFLPPHWSRSNPIDILGDAGAERYAKALEIAAKDPNSNGLLVILTPQDMTDPLKTAELLKPYANIPGKPLIASWMGGQIVSEAVDVLNRSGIPTFTYPDRAVRAFVHMWKYNDNLSQIYEVPALSTEEDPQAPDREAAEAIIQSALKAGRTILSETESKDILSAYRIPVVSSKICKSADEACAVAKTTGFPVVLKLHSETLTHKTDVGGVILNLQNESSVRDAYTRIYSSVCEKAGAEHFGGVAVQPMITMDGYELILGSSADTQLGQVLLFGLGGQLVEVFKDRALGLPPLNRVLARRLMEKTKIYKALQGVRGRRSVNLTQLEDILVRFSQMVLELNLVKECDINPLLASPHGLIALDARFVLHTEEEAVNTPTSAIRPYPSKYKEQLSLKDGSSILVRPILPEDFQALVEFHKSLSKETVRQRYNRELDLEYRISTERLRRICFVDYDRELVFVSLNSQKQAIAVARLSKSRSSKAAKMSLIISDAYQHQTLGKQLVKKLIDVAKAEKVETLKASFLESNIRMARICTELGFKADAPKNGMIKSWFELSRS